MVEVFLGYPPPKMIKWIDEHAGGQSDGTQFVDAVYTDEWVFSDGQEHVITYDTMTLTIDNGLTADMNQMFFEDGTIMQDVPEYWNLSDDELRKFLEKVVVARYDDLGVTAYRKYTPAHWENTETGEWTDGSWSAWTIDGIPNADIPNPNVDNWRIIEHDDHLDLVYPYAVGDETTHGNRPSGLTYADDKNSVIVSGTEYSNGANIAFIATRTWNNTKPAPAA